MDRSLSMLGIGNRPRQFDVYYNLPKKLERYNPERPTGMKHAKSTDIDVVAKKLFWLSKEED